MVNGGVKEKKKPVTPKQVEKEVKKKLAEKEAEEYAKQFEEQLKKEKEYEERMKKYDIHSGIVTDKESKYLGGVLDKCTEALETKADKHKVAKLMMDIAKQIRNLAGGPEAEALGVILQKIAARRPDAWQVLKKIAAKEKGGPASWAVTDVTEALMKSTSVKNYINKYVKTVPDATINTAVDSYLADKFAKLPGSKLTRDETMAVIGIIEYHEGKTPLQVTKSWFKFEGKAKMKLLEESSLLMELHKRRGSKVDADYLVDYSLKLQNKMYKHIDSSLVGLGFMHALGDPSVKTLDDAVFKSLQYEELRDLMPSPIRKMLDESGNLMDFVKALKSVKGAEKEAAETFLKQINKYRGNKSLIALFEARITVQSIAEPQVLKELFGIQMEQAAKARKLVKWSAIKESIALFGKTLFVEKIGGPWVELYHAWKTPISKTGTWRYRTSANWRVGKQLLALGGIAAGVALIGVGIWFFTKYKPNQKTIKDFRAYFKDNFNVDSEKLLSDEAILFYFGTDKGRAALDALQGDYPKEKSMQYLLTMEVESVTALENNVLGVEKPLIKPEKFKDLLEDLMNTAKTSTKEPIVLVGDKIEEWNKKGYMMTVGEIYVRQFCKGLGIDKRYAMEFVKNEKAFIKMWDLINSGKLPRSMAPEYAAVAMGKLPYKEKEKKLEAMVLENPLPAWSIIDVLDQYAVFNSSFKEVYKDILEMYKTDDEARKNLSEFKITKGDAIYGNLWGLVMLAYGIARGEVTKKNDPREKLISGDAKFKSEKGLPEEKHYWVWIGDSSLMTYYPILANDEKNMKFILKYSGYKEGEAIGMMKWLLDFKGKIKNPPAVVAFFMKGWKNLDKYWMEKKKTYDYPGIYSFMNNQVSTLKNQKLYLEGEMEPEASLIPIDIFPKGGAIKPEEKKEIKKEELLGKVETDNPDFFGYVYGGVDLMKEQNKTKKEYEKALDKGYTDAQVKEEAAKHFALYVYDATEGKEKAKTKAIEDLKNWGVVIEEGKAKMKDEKKFMPHLVGFVKGLPKLK